MNRFRQLFNKPWIPCTGLVIVITVHLYLTALGDPLGVGFDFVLWGIACVLKILVWLALLQTLPALYRRCNQSPRRGVIFTAAFALLLLSAVLLLAHQRALIASVFSNAAVKYYPPTGDAINPQAYIGFADWLPRWRNGQVLAVEIWFAMSLALLHGVVGVKLGGNPKAAVVVGLVGTFALAGLQWAAFGLVVCDYDFFHGDIISGGFLFDLAIPIASDPYAAVGSLVYLMFSLAALPVLGNDKADWVFNKVFPNNT